MQGLRVSPLLGAFLVAVDLAGLWASARATGAARIALNRLFHHGFTEQLVQALFPPFPLLALCWVAALGWFGAYDLLGKRSSAEVFRETLKAVSLAMCLQIVLLFLFTRSVYSRSLLLLFWALSLGLLTASRELAFWALRHLKARGFAAEPVGVVGTGPMARLLGRKIEADREPRFRLRGFVSDAHTTDEERRELGAQILGHADRCESIINEHGLRRLFLANPSTRSGDAAGLVLLCERMGVGVERVPDLQGLLATRVRVTEIDGVPLLSFRPMRFTRWDEIVKRSADIVLSALGLVVLAFPVALISLAIKLEDAGPVLFIQHRVGRGGKHFRLLKFRSMKADAERERATLEARNEASGHIFKLREDPRVTGVGRLLRRFSLDELPQLWNVLVGEMSLVGPRPLPRDDIEDPDSAFAYWITRRRTVRPGITGLWQVSGRSELPFAEMVTLDLHYINNWSLWLDLRLLARTVPVVLRGSGAY